MKKSFSPQRLACLLLILFVWCVLPSYAGAVVFYETSFGTASSAAPLSGSATSAQDDWYAPAHPENTLYGEDLELSTEESYGNGEQTIARRDFATFDLSSYSKISLTVDFAASYIIADPVPVSHQIYEASLGVRGGPHPGFSILDFVLQSGNDTQSSREDLGVNVRLGAFNGVDNNVPVPLNVGQGLEWDTWYSLTLVGDLVSGRYVSLTVDGNTQDLSAYLLPRSLDAGAWLRGGQIDEISTSIVDFDENFVGEASDTVSWDNLAVEIQPIPEPGTILLLGSGLAGLAASARRKKR